MYIFSTLGISYTPKLRNNESSYSEFHDIVNKSQLPLLLTKSGYSEFRDIVNKRSLTRSFVISKFGCIYIYCRVIWEKKFILISPMCIEEPDLKKELKTIRNYSQASLCDKNYSFFSCQTYCTYKIVICKSWWQGKWKKEKFAQNTLQEHAAKFLVQHIAREPPKYNNLKDKPTLENSARVLRTYVSIINSRMAIFKV